MVSRYVVKIKIEYVKKLRCAGHFSMTTPTFSVKNQKFYTKRDRNLVISPIDSYQWVDHFAPKFIKIQGKMAELWPFSWQREPFLAIFWHDFWPFMAQMLVTNCFGSSSISGVMNATIIEDLNTNGLKMQILWLHLYRKCNDIVVVTWQILGNFRQNSRV